MQEPPFRGHSGHSGHVPTLVAWTHFFVSRPRHGLLFVVLVLNPLSKSLKTKQLKDHLKNNKKQQLKTHKQQKKQTKRSSKRLALAPERRPAARPAERIEGCWPKDGGSQRRRQLRGDSCDHQKNRRVQRFFGCSD